MRRGFEIIAIVLALLSCTRGQDITDLKIERYKAEARIPVHFVPLELGSITAEGWIRDWGETAADGITGHLDERNHLFAYAWKGIDIPARQNGNDNEISSVGWVLEQGAYWLDGCLKTGAVLGDSTLIGKITPRLDALVEGVLKSENNTLIYWKADSIIVDSKENWMGSFNNWAHGLMGRTLIGYYQLSHKPEVLQALEKVYSQYFLKLPQNDIFEENAGLSQGMVRGATNLDAMSETFVLTGNRAILDTMLAYASNPMELAQEGRLLAKRERHDNNWGDATIHGVSYNEISRVPALLALWSGREESLGASELLIDWAEKYNGLPYGVVSSEEWMSGIGSQRCTETCDVPATMWTKAWMLRLTGDAGWADGIEKAFFNAGPVPVSRDFQTMCYYQSPNRVNEDTPAAPPIPGPGGRLIYSLIGNKTLCCVASCNWIIPNYVQNMWMATMDGGLAYTLYGPCKVRKQVKGVPMEIDCETAYPFGSGIDVRISMKGSVSAPMYFRMPGWCKDMSLLVNGKPVKIAADAGFVKLSRRWKDGDIIHIELPMEPSVGTGTDNCYPRDPYFTEAQWGRYNAAVDDTLAGRPFAYVNYGPLLYSLPLEDTDENSVVPGQEYGFALDPSAQIEVDTSGQMPARWAWGLYDAPVKLRIPAIRTGWQATQTDPLPRTRQSAAEGTPATITLVPYGCTKFRVSMFPVTGN
ncbi:MAG: glycoside hydrolase family 127 protein [Bacteroidales bacterium]|nr:glycoside hydrolase family 127 protein [Bacteroidales bacterium]